MRYRQTSMPSTKRFIRGEGIGNLRMRLAEESSGSLNYGADFGGQSDIQPQAYYSDSHLDTLGVCVFLALTKRYADDSRIVVLDDVFTSVDQHHLGRIWMPCMTKLTISIRLF